MKPGAESRSDKSGGGGFFARTITIPVQIDGDHAADVIHIARIGGAMLANIHFRAGGRRVADDLAILGRLHPKIGEHAGRAVEFDAGFQITVPFPESGIA